MTELKPFKFEQANKKLTPLLVNYKDLWVWSDNLENISCWKLSFWERIKLLFIGKIWISLLSGKSQPPMIV